MTGSHADARRARSKRLRELFVGVPVLRGILCGDYACTMQRVISATDGRPVFIVVHGTWARKARWTERDSPLVQGLTKTWPNAGMYRFSWSGINGAEPRLSASLALSRGIAYLTTTFPHSPIVALAHSHGGNVVAWACTRVKQPLAAAVYLNTPFIQVLREEKTDHKGLQFFILVFSLVPIMLASITLLHVAPMFKALLALVHALRISQGLSALLHVPTGSNDDATIVDLISMAVLPLALIAWLEVRVPTKIGEIRDRLVEVSNHRRNVHRELVAFVVGDEPSAALGAAFFVQWAGRKIMWLSFFGSLAAIFLLSGLEQTSFSQTFPKFVISADSTGKLLMYIFVAILCLMPILSMSAYGIVHGLVGVDANVGVTPAPIGSTDFTTVSWADRDSLRHSLIYDSPQALKAITDWLGGILK